MSVSIEDIEDDEAVTKNVAPHNKNRVLERSDGSDDDDNLPLAVSSVPGRKKVRLYS